MWLAAESWGTVCLLLWKLTRKEQGWLRDLLTLPEFIEEKENAPRSPSRPLLDPYESSHFELSNREGTEPGMGEAGCGVPQLFSEGDPQQLGSHTQYDHLSVAL